MKRQLTPLDEQIMEFANLAIVYSTKLLTPLCCGERAVSKLSLRRICGLLINLSQAWLRFRLLRELWKYRYPGNARKFFKDWYAWAIRSRLEPVKKVARMLRDHLENIITYAKHRITNAATEGMNSRIQKIKKTACGFRNMEHFKTAIYFHCGGSISTHTKPGSAIKSDGRLAWDK